MRFRALATDYDNTIALHGVVSAATEAALIAVNRSGRRLILVTGRTLDELNAVFEDEQLFDLIVLENGAVLRTPDGASRLLTAPIPERFVAELRRRDIAPLAIGRCIVSTAATNAKVIQTVIDEMALPLAITFNRDSAMVLPPSVDKTLGLRAAAQALEVQLGDIVGVGDGENDCSMLTSVGVGVAVANALDSVKECADLVLDEPGPAGVQFLCDSLVESDLVDLLGTPAPRR